MENKYIRTAAKYECKGIELEKPTPLVAFEIVEKLRDLESEIACEVLDNLITHFIDVQDYIVENYRDLLYEEEGE